MIPKSFIPSLFTTLNAFSGFMSIVASSNNDIIGAAFFIIYAMVFDALDGFVARLLKSSSEFGVELDSLSDVISFGAAPSFILYQLYFNTLDGIGILISSLIMVFGALRLARFNVQLTGFTKEYFKGVPIPMSAAIVCSYIIFYHGKVFDRQTEIYILYLMAIGLPVLMISRLKFDAMPGFSLKSIKANPVKYIIILLCIISVIATEGKALLFVFLFYILIGIYRGIINIFLNKKKNIDASENEEDDLILEENLKQT